MKLLLAVLFVLIPFTIHAENLGNPSANEFDHNSVANPFGAGSSSRRIASRTSLASMAVRSAINQSRIPMRPMHHACTIRKETIAAS